MEANKSFYTGQSTDNLEKGQYRNSELYTFQFLVLHTSIRLYKTICLADMSSV